MQPFEMLPEHQEMSRPFSFAIYGAVHNVYPGSVLVLSTTGHDVPLGLSIVNSIGKSNGFPQIAILTSKVSHSYYADKIREGGVGRYQNVTLYQLNGDPTRKDIAEIALMEHTARIFIVDIVDSVDVMNIQRAFSTPGQLHEKVTLIIISADGITSDAVDVDVIHSTANVQLD